MRLTNAYSKIEKGEIYTVKNYSVFYSVLLLNCYSERLFPQFTVNADIFLHLFPSNTEFFTV